MAHFIISIAALSIVIFTISTIMIYSYLKDRGENVSFIWLRLFMISYASKYKKITKDETGKIGYLFYYWIISINIALLCAIILLIANV